MDGNPQTWFITGSEDFHVKLQSISSRFTDFSGFTLQMYYAKVYQWHMFIYF